MATRKTIVRIAFGIDVSGLTWIRHRSIAAVYDGLVDTNGLNIGGTPWVGQLRQLYTTALPFTEGGGSEHVELIGDFSQRIIGARSNRPSDAPLTHINTPSRSR